MVVEEIERKNNPVFDFNRGIPLMGPGVQLQMKSSDSIKSGKSQYGNWYLWPATVNNATVFEGRKPNETKVDNYNGDVIFFASERMNNELIKVIGGEDSAVIRVKKEAEETPKGLVKRYTVEKIGGSKKPALDGLLPSEQKLVNDATSLIKSGYELSEDDFIKASKDTDLYGTITEERVKELYKFLK
jgi:hypothetical protein